MHARMSAARDLALAVEEHAGLLAALQRRQIALDALRAHIGTNSELLAHLSVLEVTCKDLNKPGAKSGLTPLLTACLQGNPTTVQVLLDNGADPAAEGDVYDTQVGTTGHRFKEFPLSVASRDGNKDIVEMLLAHEDVDVNQATSDTGSTALYMSCCFSNSTDICEILLRQDGIDVNKAMSERGSTPLYVACRHGNTAAVALMLAHPGINVNVAKPNDGATPLYIACYGGHIEVVRLLLAQDGIDVNCARTDGGETALIIAGFDGQIEIVKMLLAHDEIDANKARIDDGATPLYIACYSGQDTPTRTHRNERFT